ncbi:MAG: hypothetical protein JSU70_00285 [Phycisphaerales bacterium]|nr:MAG: hypothetical protein JSU70_00285 [Phycisphaerales bacterium]
MIASTHRFTSSAFAVSMAGILGVLVGMGRQMLVAWYFGAGVEMDAWFTSAAIPTYLSAVLLSGLSFVLIPALVRHQEKQDRDRAGSLILTFLAVSFVISTTVAIAVGSCSQIIIRFVAPGLDALSAGQAADLLRIQILAFPLMTTASIAMGSGNAYRLFFLPACSVAIGTLANTVSVLVLTPYLGVYALAWGWVLGYVASACFCLRLIAPHIRWSLLSLRDPELRHLGRLVLPFLLFGMLTRCVPLIEKHIASNLPVGQIAYLGYATRISRLLGSLAGGGIGVAIFPAMSRSLSRDGIKGLSETTERGLIVTLSIGVPIVTFFLVAAVPTIQLLLGRGRFDAATVEAVARACAPLAVVSVGLLLGNVLGRSFYTTQTTWITPFLGSLCVLCFLFLSHVFVSRFQYMGLAFARACATMTTVMVMMVLLMVKLRARFLQLWTFMLIYLVAAGFYVWAFHVVQPWYSQFGPLHRVVVSCVTIAAFFGAVLALWERRLLLDVLDLFGYSKIRSVIRVLRHPPVRDYYSP